MADKDLAGITAATSISASDLLYAVIGGNSRKITVANFFTSPAFVTPALGVATATSIAIGGATLGANALAVNGQVANAGGTITTSQPFTLTQTWNAAGVVFNGLLVNVTNTASATLSSFADFQIAGASYFTFDKSGLLRIPLGGGAGGIKIGGGSVMYEPSPNNFSILSTSIALDSTTVKMPSTTSFGFTSGLFSAALDATLSRNAVGVIQFGTTAANAAGSIAFTNIAAQTGYTQMAEMTAPSAGAADTVRFYAEDNGGGKTRLMALFSSGAAQQIAIQP